MQEVTFYLALPSSVVFPPASLAEIARLVVGTPVRDRVGSDGEQVGDIVSATVEGDRVLCTAKIEDTFAEAQRVILGGEIRDVSIAGGP